MREPVKAGSAATVRGNRTVASQPSPRAGLDGAAAPVPTGGGLVEQASPEEQDLYERFVALGLMAVYDEKMLPQTLQMIKGAPDPAKGVADAASAIVVRVYTEAMEGGLTLPSDVVLHGSAEVVEGLIEVTEKAGIAEFNQDMLETATYMTADLLAKEASRAGLYTQDQAAEDMEGFNEAKRTGRLDAVMGALDKMKGKA